MKDLSEDLDFAKNQLLVARESVIAARQKQQAATEAHEEDLKALKVGRPPLRFVDENEEASETLSDEGKRSACLLRRRTARRTKFCGRI